MTWSCSKPIVHKIDFSMWFHWQFSKVVINIFCSLSLSSNNMAVTAIRTPGTTTSPTIHPAKSEPEQQLDPAEQQTDQCPAGAPAKTYHSILLPSQSFLWVMSLSWISDNREWSSFNGKSHCWLWRADGNVDKRQLWRFWTIFRSVSAF